MGGNVLKLFFLYLCSSPNDEDIDNNIHSHQSFLTPGSFNFSMAALTDPTLSGELVGDTNVRSWNQWEMNSVIIHALIRF